MRTADLACALLLVGVAGVAVTEGLRLGIGWGSDGPEPGFFVFYLASALGLSVLAGATRTLGARREGSAASFVTRAQLRRVATVLVPAVGMVALVPLVGLYVAGTLYLTAYVRGIGRHSWGAAVVVGLGIPAVTFLIFELWFLVPLPKGPLETWLGY